MISESKGGRARSRRQTTSQPQRDIQLYGLRTERSSLSQKMSPSKYTEVSWPDSRLYFMTCLASLSLKRRRLSRGVHWSIFMIQHQIWPSLLKSSTTDSSTDPCSLCLAFALTEVSFSGFGERRAGPSSRLCFCSAKSTGQKTYGKKRSSSWSSSSPKQSTNGIRGWITAQKLGRSTLATTQR